MRLSSDSGRRAWTGEGRVLEGRSGDQEEGQERRMKKLNGEAQRKAWEEKVPGLW